MKDIRGVEINEGDRVAYGRSQRFRPISIGTVLYIEEELGYITIQCDNGERESVIYSRWLVVLPDNY